MTEPTSLLLKTLVDRGHFHQCTDIEALDKAASEKIVTGYIGFDCTADSLHVGSLTQIMTLRRMQQAGHKPIVLMGGGTTRIGDPSGKDEARSLLTDEQIAHNMAGIRKVFSQYLTFGDGPTDAVMVNNNDWLDGLQYIAFLRDYGRHFSVNRMLSFDSVKLRLEREQPLSFLEFNYMILQAYDFVELARRLDCSVQFGGSDQWGNIVNGVELGRRVLGRELYGFTSPLLTTASGAKMGKSASGAVWLNADKLGAYEFWQYWRNTEDDDVARFMRLFTELPLDEIARLTAENGPGINDAKKVLANEVTAMAHGHAAAEAAAETARRVFEEGATGEGMARIEVAKTDLDGGIAVVELFVRAGLAASNGEARRLIKGGGGRMNDVALTDERHNAGAADVTAEGVIKLTAGKKRHALIVPV
ncbi:MAG TPA: tyrosine--tRNA ligase [Aliidongia sp.]|uniref:tyrosine--tRNA ligase n=1 Tax=Aliidongia sp. TaxID=1914230 RepID=UPI002DDD78EF|nr:tyrosine--tRNA ligase [Aliidongia sp.]HEV2674374.1 tyrosine--tRNA ligase [Aliidongia sp.]